MKQTVRIIGGRFRGKKLTFPDIKGLRPTPDRVKETLFNWLMNQIKAARCLDVFAGSGALGFEAYSRGAQRVVLLEYSSKAYQNLCNIAAQFNSTALSIVHTAAEDYFQQSTEQFDIVFLDPPFEKKEALPQFIVQLIHRNLLKKGGLVYIESPVKLQLDSLYWQEKKAKRAGQVFYSLYERK